MIYIDHIHRVDTWGRAAVRELCEDVLHTPLEALQLAKGYLFRG
mgnify:CR=1 FL=1